MYDPAKVAQAFGKLFQSYPSFQAGGADETLPVYFEAVEPYQTGDILDAVTNFLTGKAPGVNPSFAPPAPALASECRRVMNLRLEHERIMRPALPPPPEPEISEAERARVAAGFKRLSESLGKALEPSQVERDKRSKERGEREIRWLKNRGDLIEIPGNSLPISRTLAKKLGVGDPEGDTDAA